MGADQWCMWGRVAGLPHRLVVAASQWRTRAAGWIVLEPSLRLMVAVGQMDRRCADKAVLGPDRQIANDEGAGGAMLELSFAWRSHPRRMCGALWSSRAAGLALQLGNLACRWCCALCGGKAACGHPHRLILREL